MSLRAAIVLLPAILSAAVLEDFTAKPEVSLVKESERGVTAAYATPDGGSGEALVLRYAEQHAGLNEAYFAKALPIPGPCTITLRARADAALKVWGIALRVKDAKGECFQFKGSAMPGADWTTISFDVAADTAQGHWGNPGTGVMEGTWSVCGIAASGAEAAAAGAVWIDDLTCEPKAGK